MRYAIVNKIQPEDWHYSNFDLMNFNRPSPFPSVINRRQAIKYNILFQQSVQSQGQPHSLVCLQSLAKTNKTFKSIHQYCQLSVDNLFTKFIFPSMVNCPYVTNFTQNIFEYSIQLLAMRTSHINWDTDDVTSFFNDI